MSIRVTGLSTQNERAEFGATGKTITFYGFLKAYVESADDPSTDRDDQERRLPNLAEGDPLTANSVDAEGHSTRPPARYTEASLVKELEEREIGRPSTYASIIGTILAREYVFKKGTALVPSFLAFAVTNLLEQHFGNLVDYDFTAHMEDGLDEIARGDAERVPWLNRFYYGDTGEEGLRELVGDISDIDAKGISSFPIKGTDILVRVGRYGSYLDRDGDKVNIPDDIAPDELTGEKAEELFAQPSGDRELGTDPATGHTIVAKSGRFGPYVTEILPEAAPPAEGRSGRRRRTPQAAHRVAVQVDVARHDHAGRRAEAAVAAAHPRRAGRRAGDRAERPVRPVHQAGHRQPLARLRGRAVHRHAGAGEGAVRAAQAARPPGRGRRALRELGKDPASEKPVVVKEGRFGPYVTDGETNASLRKGDEVESITIQRAAELLAERREKVAAGGGKKKTTTRRRTSAKSGS